MIAPEENILFEDALAKVILAFDPISKAHVVIVPNKPYLDIDELPTSLLNHLMKLAQCFVRLLKMEYAPNGYSIMQNGGAFNDTGQFHLHVFPRQNKEQFAWKYGDELEDGATNYGELQSQLKDQFEQMVKDYS